VTKVTQRIRAPIIAADQKLYGDHIAKLLDGGALLDSGNVMLRCAPCHGRKTADEARKRMARLDVGQPHVVGPFVG
jgi:hypothetical protein